MTYGKAVHQPEADMWRDERDLEMKAIRKSKTWHSTNRPVGRRVLKGKWV